MPKKPNYDDLPVSVRDRASVAIGLGERTPIRWYYINCCCGCVRERRTEEELEDLQRGSHYTAYDIKKGRRDILPYACPKLRAFEHEDIGCEPDDVGQRLMDEDWSLVQGAVSESEWSQSAAAALWVHPKCLAALERAGQARKGYAHYCTPPWIQEEVANA
jgi:hypothetical protein